MERWRNKVALVTGASSGIGAACCRDLVAQGMIVVGTARRMDAIEQNVTAQLSPECKKRFHAIKCDLTQEQEIKKVFAWIEQHLKGVDVLINNAGYLRSTGILSANNSDDLATTLNTNVLATCICAREAFRSMRERNVEGHIININSIVGHAVPHVPGTSLGLYIPTKHSITALTEVLRQELLDMQSTVKVTSLSPGLVDTDMVDHIRNLPKSQITMLQPQDIAEAIRYCLQSPPHVQIYELTIKSVKEIY